MLIEETVRPSVCYRHPERETKLGCGRCGKPICSSCARSTTVGYRCPDCVQELQSRYHTGGGYINPLAGDRVQPILTYSFLALIVVIFVLEEVAGGSTNNEVLVRFGASYGPFILQGEIWRLLSSMFVHIGMTHLMFNGFALYTIGRDVEIFYGHERFAVVYFGSGLFGSLVSFAIRGPMEFSAGASGAIFGLIGAELAFLWFHRERLGELGRQHRKRILGLIVLNLIIGFSIAVVNNAAHIGGLIGGFALGYLLAPRYMPALGREGNYIVDHGSLLRRWWVVLLTLLILVGGTWGTIHGWQSYPGVMARLSSPLSGLPLSEANETAAPDDLGDVEYVRLSDDLECLLIATDEGQVPVTAQCQGVVEALDEGVRREIDLTDLTAAGASEGRRLRGRGFHLAVDISVESGRVRLATADRRGQLKVIDSDEQNAEEEGVYVGVVSSRFTLFFEPMDGPARQVNYWIMVSAVEE